MGKRETVIRLLKKFKYDTSKDIPISKLILFGSFARGSVNKYSDLDLVVVSNKFGFVPNLKNYKPLLLRI